MYQNLSIRERLGLSNNTEYYEDYYREIWEYYLPGPIVALFLFLNGRTSIRDPTRDGCMKKFRIWK